MQEFVFIFRSAPGNTDNLSEEELNAYYGRWRTWFEKLNGEGKYVSGERLMDEDANVLSGEEKVITDGPYAESKELVGGIAKIKAENIKEAVEIAKDCPIYKTGGSVEVRRNYT